MLQNLDAGADTEFVESNCSMLRRMLSLVALLSSIGCDRPGAPEPALAMRISPQCPTAGKPTFYPDGTFDSRRFGTAIQNTVASGSRMLEGMRELPLSCGSMAESYRFLWVHSFSSSSAWAPTMVRVTRSGAGWIAIAVRLTNAVDRKEADRREVKLTDEGSREVLAALAEFNLWQRPDFAYTPMLTMAPCG